MSQEPGTLTHARYGKDLVRVLRVVREGAWHHVVEYNVRALVEGEIETSYTKADNSCVVATDSIKNITYYLAKTSPHVLHPERFALHLATFLVSKYAHLSKSFVDIEMLRWTRIPVSAASNPEKEKEKAHTHSFYRDGEEKRTVSVEVDATAGKDKLVAKVTSGLKGLLVLKTTGSAFENFVRDEYTTLVEVNDRIFSTSIDLTYTYKPIPIPAPTDEKKLAFDLQSAGTGDIWDGDNAATLARNITLEVFATDDSASVQATLYIMAQRIIAENSFVQSVTYTLPNKHYIPVDMRYIGVDNLTPAKAEVFTPIAAPSGLISATVSRK
ncbi:uricase [Punctularia strigosozonata HHB-11173 SS5]|uniref:uricase n=1 Tax=Punctularia strigosozonata (strain HHB-11173) TaxID=741275 RepID=UPI0004416DA6|nr:uricase [Punctularia strigosozonata HHB-11173 SS5]EIN05494.1 uricase [Punctularia strigosozonata HHB-11173 SS5]